MNLEIILCKAPWKLCGKLVIPGSSEPLPTALWRLISILLKVKGFFFSLAATGAIKVEPNPHSRHVLDTALEGKYHHHLLLALTFPKGYLLTTELTFSTVKYFNDTAIVF